MATIIIDVQSNEDARKVADAVRLMKSVKKVSVWENDKSPCRFTVEEIKQRISKAETDIAAGRFTPHSAIERKNVQQ